MSTYQTSVQDSTALMEGSAKVSIAVYAGSPSWLDVGIVENLAANEVMTISQRRGDNGVIDDHVSDHHGEITFDQVEALSEDARAIMRGTTFDTLSTVAADAVSGEDQVVQSGDWSFDGFIPLTGKESDGTEPTINSVTLGTDGAIVLNTDYAVVEDPDGSGNWGIVITDSATVTTEAQTVTINTDYTPAASHTVKTGGLASGLPRFMIKMENLNSSGKYVRLTFYSVRIDQGTQFAFKKDNDADNIVRNPIKLMADFDLTKDQGLQLYDKYTEGGL